MARPKSREPAVPSLPVLVESPASAASRSANSRTDARSTTCTDFASTPTTIASTPRARSSTTAGSKPDSASAPTDIRTESGSRARGAVEARARRAAP